MKRGILIILIVFVLSFVSAIRINEIELNPAGKDSGEEWIEFYSEENVEGNYTIKNNDGDELEIYLDFEGYFVYELEKQWLDNEDEGVLLYDEDLIDESKIIFDTENNEMTLQFCDGDWWFRESTRDEESDCSYYEEPEEEEEAPLGVPQDTELGGKDEDKKNEDVEDDKKLLEEIKEEEIEEVKNEITLIKLEPKTIKSEEDLEKPDKNYAIYGFVFFCFLLGFLFLLKKKISRKNEFE
ncbi:hypothetical protein ACFL0X_00580 [Nanoarchaeota archaeon]